MVCNAVTSQCFQSDFVANSRKTTRRLSGAICSRARLFSTAASQAGTTESAAATSPIVLLLSRILIGHRFHFVGCPADPFLRFQHCVLPKSAAFQRKWFVTLVLRTSTGSEGHEMAVRRTPCLHRGECGTPGTATSSPHLHLLAPPGHPSSSGISSWSSKAQWTSSSASVAVSVPASPATLFFRNMGFWCHTALSRRFEVFSKKVTTASSIQHRASPPDRWQIYPQLGLGLRVHVCVAERVKQPRFQTAHRRTQSLGLHELDDELGF